MSLLKNGSQIRTPHGQKYKRRYITRQISELKKFQNFNPLLGPWVCPYRKMDLKFGLPIVKNIDEDGSHAKF